MNPLLILVYMYTSVHMYTYVHMYRDAHIMSHTPEWMIGSFSLYI